LRRKNLAQLHLFLYALFRAVIICLWKGGVCAIFCYPSLAACHVEVLLWRLSLHHARLCAWCLSLTSSLPGTGTPLDFASIFRGGRGVAFFSVSMRGTGGGRFGFS
jgi:hypothetical protein